MTIKLNDEDSFKNAVTGYSKALETISEQMSDFWSERMNSEEIKDFADQRMPEKIKRMLLKLKTALLKDTINHMRGYYWLKKS